MEPEQDDPFPPIPLYFKSQSVPPCAYYLFDKHLEGFEPSEEEIERTSKQYPKSETVTPGEEGYIIKKGSFILTIRSNDPHAYLKINHWLEIAITGRSFTFPLGLCSLYTVILFHLGPVTLEYREIHENLKVVLRTTQFNMAFRNRKNEQRMAYFVHNAISAGKFPTAVNFKKDATDSELQIFRGQIAWMLEEKLLHYIPYDGDFDPRRNHWDLERLKRDAKLFVYCSVGDQLSDIFILTDPKDIALARETCDVLKPRVTKIEEKTPTTELWREVESHYDDDLDLDRSDPQFRQKLLDRKGVTVYMENDYILQWGRDLRK